MYCGNQGDTWCAGSVIFLSSRYYKLELAFGFAAINLVRNQFNVRNILLFPVHWEISWSARLLLRALSYSRTNNKIICFSQTQHDYVVCFLLGNSPASEFYMPTFWDTLFHLHRQVSVHLLAYEDGIECSETSAYKTQTPESYPEENIQHTEHGERLKSRIKHYYMIYFNLLATSFDR